MDGLDNPSLSKALHIDYQSHPLIYEYNYNRHTLLNFDRTRPKHFRLVVLNHAQLVSNADHIAVTAGVSTFKKEIFPLYKDWASTQTNPRDNTVGEFMFGKFQAASHKEAHVRLLQGAQNRMKLKAFIPGTDKIVNTAGYLKKFDVMIVLTPELPRDRVDALEEFLVETFADGFHPRCCNQAEGGRTPWADAERKGFVYVVERLTVEGGLGRAALLGQAGSANGHA